MDPLSKIITLLKEDALKNLDENKTHWANPSMDPETSALNNFRLPLYITQETFEGTTAAAATVAGTSVAKSKSYVRGTRGASFNKSSVMTGGSFSKGGPTSFSKDKDSFSSAVAVPVTPQSGTFIAEDDARYVPTPNRRRSSLLASEELQGLFNKLTPTHDNSNDDSPTKNEDSVLLVKPAARRPSLFVGDILPQNPSNTLKEEEEEPENPWENDLSI